MNTENNNAMAKLYDANTTGSVWSLAVNKDGLELKSNFGTVSSVTPGTSWQTASALYSSLSIQAYGCRQDGTFIYASTLGGGNTYSHTTLTGATVQALFTNLASNKTPFCSLTPESCIYDVALDGYDYAWFLSANCDLYVSTSPQTAVFGGTVKHIGKIRGVPSGAVCWGLAFDGYANVYYAGMVFTTATFSNDGWIAKAPMVNPLASTTLLTTTGAQISDLASCAFPKTNVTALLATS
ncbi:hypothetical protein BGZ99_004382 [Dissophora globulifera]|uniref:Uncharacterized protein n=1 Tax=Dissophora globulifera TaxID=979702 RepID=A0A9P6RI52_9FUNG|nr:hypothetical protein BGZ99_004382 [Dissophora globulifera]